MAILFVIYIVKYKINGLLAVITFITNTAIFLILIRVTDIKISLNSFAGIAGIIVLNAILVNNILKTIKENNAIFSENIKKAYIKTIDSFIIMLIIFVIFAFSGMTVINVVGLLIFWGWVVTLLGNLILTVPILDVVNNKK